MPTRRPRSRSITPPPRSRRRSRVTGSRSSSRPAAWRRRSAPFGRGGRGGDGPRIGILAEYDALPGLGHGCGHNTMAASGVGAAIALASMADELPGEIVFLGTPAEERGSGKAIMIEDGLIRRHRCRADVPPVRPQPRRELAAGVRGRRRRLPRASRHTPRRIRGMGRNALDAMILLFSVGRALAPAASTHRPRPRDHPRGRDGREHHPGADSAWFMIRSRRRGLLRDDARPVPRCSARRPRRRPARPSTVTFSGKATTMNNNQVLAERFRANMAAYGIVDQGDDENAGSTDMANVSWVCPTIHPDLAIAPEGTPGHSILFRDAAITPRGGRGDAPRRDPRRPDRVRALRGPGSSSRPHGRPSRSRAR